ncbi:hypothetical protein PVAND_013397 [Polypedilum vanderplanki]|uniref:Radial spokehead-like protein n=1 Tax=Polypedilum vanderplanki TaxID=319348 RepID=A0A9J6CQJ4_POLVA|nr:hypothetical protein PVAND_013397 [Polypedilum vanderplanki]
MTKNNNKSNRNKQMADDAAAVPSLRKDLLNAKLFMQQSSNDSGDSLYDHLSRVIAKVIDERPINVVDYFELFSERVRMEKFRMNELNDNNAYQEPQRLAIAKRLLPTLIEKSRQQQQQRLSYVNKNEMKSIKANDNSEESSDAAAADDEEKEDEKRSDVIYYEAPAVKDLCELQFYWNLLGIGFPREEIFLLSCAMRKLKMNASIASCRFWGKIFGRSNDYYIVECTLTVDALESRIDAIEKAINIMNLESPNEECAEISNASSEKTVLLAESSQIFTSSSHYDDDMDDNDGNIQEPHMSSYPTAWNFSMKIPETSNQTSIEIPAEEIGHGVNRNVYYVCNNLSDEIWIELPSATPHQINVARRIRNILTGNLDASISSYPSFPGTERNYLRAIIARISAGTHVAPENFYRVGRETLSESVEEFEGENEDEGNNDKPIKVNDSYIPLSIEKLLKLDYWQHIKPEILKQGRVSYFDGQILAKYHNSINDEDEDDGSMDDDEENSIPDVKHNDLFPEMPVPLFASCSGDRLTNDIISPWTIRLNDVLESPLVLLQSNIWPGAFSFVKERICDNIYIGFGHKYSSINYSPPALPQLPMEYPHSEDCEEVNDPTTTMMMMMEENENNEDADEVESLKMSENQ